MYSKSTKAFILSLDGATFDVVRPMVLQGYMPNLARVINDGCSSDLESVVPPVTAPAWTSFMTGKNPNKHGIFDFTRFDTSSYQWKINNSEHVRSKTLWQILSDNGKQIVVLGLPYTYPTYDINGVMVAGWDAPTMSSFTFPQDVAKEIFEVIPDYGSALDLSLWNYLPADSDKDFTAFLDKLVLSFKQTATLSSHFLKTREWDVFMVHFQQTDWLQHKLWGYIERACASKDDKAKRLEQVRECYQVFDHYVGELLQQVAPLDPVRIILSDHGFGSNRGAIHPNYLLRKLGHYHLNPQIEGGFKRSLKHSRYRTVRAIYGTFARTRNSAKGRQSAKKYKSWADMANDTIPREKIKVDWQRTKAAFVGGSEVGFIFVNVKGRGPLGCVEPGAEYEQLVTKLVAEFEALVDSETGNKLLARVARGSDAYLPPSDGVLLPDIVLIPVEGYVVSPGLAEPFHSESGERGDHRHNGILLAYGPGLQRGLATFDPFLIDLAPTILHALGLPVPSDMDGKVLETLFSDPVPVQIEKVNNSRFIAARDYGQQESDLVEERLRGLGYVE